MGGTTGGLIYYTMMCKILSIIKRRNILTDALIMSIEENILKKNLGYSIILGGTIGYITGNIYRLLER
tara:strand:+ start:223 stop:426 length:204 start_codon:yes stop_codon:yes gene_type:complete